MNRRAGKVPPVTENNRSIIPKESNIIQTPQPATVRSVGCSVLILFVIFGIVYIGLQVPHGYLIFMPQFVDVGIFPKRIFYAAFE